MKKCKRLVALTMAVLIAFVCFALPSLAVSTASQYGLEATIVTDKESYKANEEIHVTVTVKNTNDFKVEAVSIESLLPETLTLKDGSNSTKTVDLEPGETLTLSFTAVKDKEEISATEPESQSTEPTETEPVLPSESETVKPSESESVKPSETETVQPSESETVKPSETETQQPTQAPTTEQPTQGTTTPITMEPTTTGGTTPAPNTTGTQSTTGGIIGDLTTTFPKITTPANSATTAQAENPDTGDSMSVKTLAIAIIALLSVIVVVIILMYKYKKQTTKIISLVMCVAISASAITGVTFFTAEGADDGRKSFTVEKVIMVDGEETNVNAKVKYQDKTPFLPVYVYSDTFDILVGEKQEVSFYAKNDIESEISISEFLNEDNSIGLYSEEGFVVALYDNGEGADEVANDGVFSGKVLLSSEIRKVGKYFAKYNNQKSLSCNISFYQELSVEEENQINSLNDDINAIKNKYILDDEKQYDEDVALARAKQAYAAIITYLNNCENLTYDVADFAILVTFDFNYNYAILITDLIPNSRKAAQRKEIQKANTNFIDSSKSKIITLQPSYNDLPSSKYDEAAKTIAKADSNYVFDTNLDNEQVTIEVMKSLSDYRIIIIDGHGGNWNPEGYILSLSEAATEEKNTRYLEDLGNRIIRDNGGHYVLTEAFFDKYYSEGSFDNSLIYLGTCHGGDNNVGIRRILAEKGAKTVLSYRDTVTNKYSNQMASTIFSELAKGLTMGDALQKAKEKHGEFDPYLSDEEYNALEFQEKMMYELGILNIESTAELILTGDNMYQLDGKIVKFAGGKGTINDPYQIANAQQLNAVRYNLKSNFVLVNDIDLSEYENWVPIGGIKDVEAYDGFQGTFDGKGHTIKNLKMDYTLSSSDTNSGTTYQFGLFSNTQNSPGIKNVNLKDVDIKVQLGLMEYSYQEVEVGTIVAYGSEITNCTATGNIKVIDVYEKPSTVYIGGICRRATQVMNCLSDVNITYGKSDIYQYNSGSVCIGGIVADSENIYNCTNYGNIVCLSNNIYTTRCGGIVGNGYRMVNQCKNYGNIDVTSNKDIDVGGVVGVGNKLIENCINYGQISARNYGGNTIEAGGIVGEFSGSYYEDKGDKIDKSVNCGNVTAISTNISSSSIGKTFTGGIAGATKGYSTISNCYNLSASLLSRSQSQNGTVLTSYIARVSNDLGWLMLSNNYSLDTTTLNGSIPTEDIGPDQKNGGSMTKAEIEKAIQELGFELPGELPAAS